MFQSWLAEVTDHQDLKWYQAVGHWYQVRYCYLVLTCLTLMTFRFVSTSFHFVLSSCFDILLPVGTHLGQMQVSLRQQVRVMFGHHPNDIIKHLVLLVHGDGQVRLLHGREQSGAAQTQHRHDRRQSNLIT